tara:strand:- start:176 stop:490 length:315 start_codon:yes stop_codon:yes gene_type:complete
MSDILMPGQGGKRHKRKMTANEVHNELVNLQNHVGQFARAVGNDFQQFQTLVMALLDELGMVEEYECGKCNQKEIMIPKMKRLEIVPQCPTCGEILVDENEEEE